MQMSGAYAQNENNTPHLLLLDIRLWLEVVFFNNFFLNGFNLKTLSAVLWKMRDLINCNEID